MRLPNPKRIKIGDWGSVRKVGVDGMYQVMVWDEHGRVVIEQNDGGYKHRIKVQLEELIK